MTGHGLVGIGRNTLAAVVVSALLLLVPAVASASFYLSFNRAQAITHDAIRISGSRTDQVWPGCWPSYRRHTASNLRVRWHLWTCTWTALFTKLADASHYRCTGGVVVEGRRTRRGYAIRQLGPARCTAVGTAPPSKGGGPSQQEILNHADQWAVSVGRAQISPVTRTYKSTVNGCTMIRPDTGRCTVWRWVSAAIVGADGSGNDIYRVEFFRIYAFSQWLTSNGIYDDYTQEFDIGDPAQTCLVVSYGDHDSEPYSCTTLTPGA